MSRPLRIYRQQISKQTDGGPCPWRIRCGCGAVINCHSFEYAAFRSRLHMFERHG